MELKLNTTLIHKIILIINNCCWLRVTQIQDTSFKNKAANSNINLNLHYIYYLNYILFQIVLVIKNTIILLIIIFIIKIIFIYFIITSNLLIYITNKLY